jgi:hypothetical protein
LHDGFCADAAVFSLPLYSCATLICFLLAHHWDGAPQVELGSLRHFDVVKLHHDNACIYF